MESNHDKLYSILLDVQKQIGNIDAENRKQSETLRSIESQAIKTNGRITVLETKVESHGSTISNWKGKLAVTLVIGGALWNLLVDYVKTKL